MSGFGIDSGQITITNGARTVQTTAGTLVNLLPAAYDYTATLSVVFPDFTKDYAYNWWFVVQSGGGGNYGLSNGCTSAQTIPKQDFSDTAILRAAPSGTDFFLSRVRMNRTSAPTHSWGGSTISPLPVMNQWIPFSGSVLMEAELGMARAFSIYVTGGNLVLQRQQSVSVPAGGYGSYGTSSGSPGAKTGGVWRFGSQQGIPVQTLSNLTTGPVVDTNSFPISDRDIGQTTSCSTSLSSNYGSTYSVEVVGSFGRRS